MVKITFVDKNDTVIGAGSKSEALAQGIVHRVIRVLVFNNLGKLLIQKRSDTVVSPGRWDTSAAGHVDEGEDYLTAAKRELHEEVGITGVELAEVCKYYTETSSEPPAKLRFNTLYRTVYSGPIIADKTDVAETQWLPINELEKWMAESPEDFTRGMLKAYKEYTTR